MGVRTKIWGPHAWVFLHGLAHALDECELPQRRLAWARFNRLMQRLVLYLPCVYCRVSYSGFTSPPTGSLSTQLPLTDPEITSAYAWSVAIHNSVNRKLEVPELSVEQAQRENPPVSLTSARWMNAWFQMVAFVLSDYQKRPVCRQSTLLNEFLPEVVDLLRVLDHPFVKYVDRHYPDLWQCGSHCVSSRLEQRLRCLCRYRKAWYAWQPEARTIYTITRAGQLATCLSAIVGCTTAQKGVKGCV